MRMHRPGQKRTARIFRVFAENSLLESDIRRVQEQELGLINAVMRPIVRGPETPAVIPELIMNFGEGKRRRQT
jgi:SNF2 family DNA or RNA helicase